jgi:short-subunit dehydrogenase
MVHLRSACDGDIMDKVALITGASSGIGAALALEFARQGAHVALVARRRDRLAAVASEVERLGRRAHVLVADVRFDDEVKRIVADTRVAFGRLDIVVANAGIAILGPVEQLTVDNYQQQFATNVFGVLRTIQATLPDLKLSRGRLVIIGSVAAYVSLPEVSPYSMSKAAVRALAEALRHELAPAGVSVTLVNPGFVASEMRRVNNEGHFLVDSHDPAPNWLIMPAAEAARRIVRGAARRRQEIIVTGHAKVMVFLQRHAPGLLSLLVRRLRPN